MGLRRRQGSAHDLTYARIWGIVHGLAANESITLADKGYTGTGDPVPRAEQARLPEGRQSGSRATARSGRAGQRPAQVPAHLAQATLLSLARLGSSPSHHVLQACEIAG